MYIRLTYLTTSDTILIDKNKPSSDLALKEENIDVYYTACGADKVANLLWVDLLVETMNKII